jgi:death-on-curing protein
MEILTTTRYVTISELVYINGRLLNDEKILRGEQKIREMEGLEAAAARPAQSAFGADAYPTLREKAAVLFHSIARNHPFKDGNKRTATVAMLFMLETNGQQVQWDAPTALERIVTVAEGLQAYSALADWLPLTPCPPTPDADSERDMQIIQHILETQRWLLHELATR